MPIGMVWGGVTDECGFRDSLNGIVKRAAHVIRIEGPGPRHASHLCQCRMYMRQGPYHLARNGIGKGQYLSLVNSVRLNFCIAVALSDASGQYGRSIQLPWPSH